MGFRDIWKFNFFDALLAKTGALAAGLLAGWYFGEGMRYYVPYIVAALIICCALGLWRLQARLRKPKKGGQDGDSHTTPVPPP